MIRMHVLSVCQLSVCQCTATILTAAQWIGKTSGESRLAALLVGAKSGAWYNRARCQVLDRQVPRIDTNDSAL